MLLNNEIQQRQLAAAIAAGKNIIVTAPTGSGKSIVTTHLLSQTEKKAVVCQPRISNVMSVYQGAKKLFRSSIGWRTAENEGGDLSANVQVVTDGLAFAAGIEDSDIVVVDEAHEMNNNMIGLLFLAKKQGKQIIVLSATIEQKIEKLSAYLDAEHLDFSGAERKHGIEIDEKTIPTMGVSSFLTDYLPKQNHNSVLIFGAGVRELEDYRYDLLCGGVPSHEIAVVSAENQEQYLAQILGEKATSVRYWLVTNFAQAGITPADCDAVVITGLKKEIKSARFADNLLKVKISKEDFTQQAGRTGRTVAGKVYAAVRYEQCPETSEPEITRTRVTGLALSLLSKGIKLSEAATELLYAPTEQAIENALAELQSYGCIIDGKLTERGRLAAALPLSINLAIGLAYAEKANLVEHYIKFAAAQDTLRGVTVDNYRTVIEQTKNKKRYNSLLALIKKAYQKNTTRIKAVAEKIAYKPQTLAECAVLSAPYHLLTLDERELFEGSYLGGFNSSLSLVSVFVNEGRTYVNQVASIAPSSPAAKSVLLPLKGTNEEVFVYPTYIEEQKYITVNALNGKIVKVEKTEIIRREWFANGIDDMPFINERNYSLNNLFSIFRIEKPSNFYGLENHYITDYCNFFNAKADEIKAAKTKADALGIILEVINFCDKRKYVPTKSQINEKYNVASADIDYDLENVTLKTEISNFDKCEPFNIDGLQFVFEFFVVIGGKKTKVENPQEAEQLREEADTLKKEAEAEKRFNEYLDALGREEYVQEWLAGYEYNEPVSAKDFFESIMKVSTAKIFSTVYEYRYTVKSPYNNENLVITTDADKMTPEAIANDIAQLSKAPEHISVNFGLEEVQDVDFEELSKVRLIKDGLIYTYPEGTTVNFYFDNYRKRFYATTLKQEDVYEINYDEELIGRNFASAAEFLSAWESRNQVAQEIETLYSEIGKALIELYEKDENKARQLDNKRDNAYRNDALSKSEKLETLKNVKAKITETLAKMKGSYGNNPFADLANMFSAQQSEKPKNNGRNKRRN